MHSLAILVVWKFLDFGRPEVEKKNLKHRFSGCKITNIFFQRCLTENFTHDQLLHY